MNKKAVFLLIFSLALLVSAAKAGSFKGYSSAGPMAFPGHFYVMNSTSLEKVSSGGEHEAIIELGANALGSKLEILGDEIFVRSSNQIRAYTLDGQSYRTISLPPDTFGSLVMLPDGRMALLNNSDDVAHFVSSDGQLLTTTDLRDTPDTLNQNLDGVVVGNRLVLSEDGDKNVLQIDLDTYERTTFKDLSALPGWIGAIDYANGYYYVCTYNAVYRFNETEEPVKVGELPAGENNIVGLQVVGNFAYVTVNFANKLYAIDLADGEATVIVTDFDHPQDIELHSLHVYLPTIIR